MGKRKASKKKNKKGEAQDSNNQNLHSNNNSSTHSQGSVDDSKSWEERDSDGGEREREEEEVLDQQQEAGEEEVQVAIEEKSLENGSGSADYSSVYVAEENPIVVSTREEDSDAGNFGEEDKEVAVVEDEEKSVIAQFGEGKAESSVIDDKAIVDYAEEEAAVEFEKSVGAQIVDDKEEEDLAKEVAEVAPKEFTSAGAESLVMLVQADELGSELAKNVESPFSQISDDKEAASSAIETVKTEQIENPVEAVHVDDQAESVVAPVVSNGALIESPVEAQAKSVVAPVVSNGAVNGAAAEPLETGNLGEAVATNNISREVDNGKDLEIQKRPSEEQPPIGTITFPVRRTSWMGCCGLFEAFSGAK